MTENPAIDQKLKKIAVINGLIMGAALLAFNIIAFYFITGVASTAVMFLIAQIGFSFILPIALVILFCFRTRMQIGGYWSFRAATTGLFIIFLIAYAFQTIGRDLVFAKFIEPNMVQKTETAALNETTLVMQKGKVDQKLIDKKVAELKKDFGSQKPITVGNVIQSLVFSIIFIFIFALVFAALFKRELPQYAGTGEEI